MLTSEFEGIWQRLTQRLEEEEATFAKEREVAPARATELLSVSNPARNLLIDFDSRFQSRALVVELIDRSRASLEVDKPMQGLPALRAALRIVLRLRPHSQKDRPLDGLCELHAEVLCELGNTWRRLAPSNQAERWFRQANRVLEESPDSAARAMLCEGLARLRSDQRYMDEAEALFARATKLWSAIGDHQRARATRKEQLRVQFRLGELDLAKWPTSRRFRRPRRSSP